MTYALISIYSKNVIGQARTSSGKTLAFAIAMFAAIDNKISKPQAICVTHNKELAVQNYNVVKRLGKFTSVTVGLALAGDKAPRGERVKPDETPFEGQIIVGTVGILASGSAKKRSGALRLDCTEVKVGAHRLDCISTILYRIH